MPAPSRVPLALLAVGTANMLARDLDLPSEPEAAAALVESEATRNVDLARIGNHRFFGNVGVGFDAQVVADIARRRAGTLGFRAYLAPIFRVLSRYREPLLEVRMNGGAPLLAGWVDDHVQVLHHGRLLAALHLQRLRVVADAVGEPARLAEHELPGAVRLLASLDRVLPCRHGVAADLHFCGRFEVAVLLYSS